MAAHSATIVPSGASIDLKDYSTVSADGFHSKEGAKAALAECIEELTKLQYQLYASNRYSLLVILQGMDASGKDSLIQHVMSGLNPQGVEVTSFKTPSTEEKEHDFLWRYHKAVPRRGRIGIFNRSHYEDVLITRVHPELVWAPGRELDQSFWDRRLKDIKNFERLLTDNGVVVRKFYLHLSKEEQRQRFLERLDEPEKHWKFAAGDIVERELWADYQHAYEEALGATSTDEAPWHVVPADKKWAARAYVARELVATLRTLDLSVPKPTPDEEKAFAKARKTLED
jgi:PPK2 family polyphosphate:nucleotide phosphotransferase